MFTYYTFLELFNTINAINSQIAVICYTSEVFDTFFVNLTAYFTLNIIIRLFA